jgi:hypothetical protein
VVHIWFVSKESPWPWCAQSDPDTSSKLAANMKDFVMCFRMVSMLRRNGYEVYRIYKHLHYNLLLHAWFARTGLAREIAIALECNAQS